MSGAPQTPPGSTLASPLGGIGYLLAAVSCFAVLDTSVKYLSTFVPVLLVLWFRYTFQALSVTLTMLPRRGMALLRTAHPRFHLLRGSLLLLVSIMAFYSLKFMPVGEFTAIAMLTPLVITALSATVFKEHVSVLRWCLVAGGFAGALLIVRPGGHNLGWAILLPIGMVSAYSCFQLLASRMAKYEDPDTTLFYTGWVGSLLTSLALPMVWVPVKEPLLQGLMMLAGILGTLGHLFLIMAFARAPASTLMPFQYTQIVIAMACGWLIFNHVPDSWAIAGISLIALCGAAGARLAAQESRIKMDPQEI